MLFLVYYYIVFGSRRKQWPVSPAALGLAAADEGLLILEKTKYWPGVIFVLQFVTLDFSYLKVEAVKIQRLLS